MADIDLTMLRSYLNRQKSFPTNPNNQTPALPRYLKHCRHLNRPPMVPSSRPSGPGRHDDVGAAALAGFLGLVGYSALLSYGQQVERPFFSPKELRSGAPQSAQRDALRYEPKPKFESKVLASLPDDLLSEELKSSARESINNLTGWYTGDAFLQAGDKLAAAADSLTATRLRD